VQQVSDAVGYGADIDRFDVESGYYPRVLGLIDEANIAEALQKISHHGKINDNAPVAPAQAGA